MSFCWLYLTTCKNWHKKLSFHTCGWFMFIVEDHNKKIKQESVFICWKRKICSVFSSISSAYKKCQSFCWHCTNYQFRGKRTNFRFYQPSTWSIKKQPINLCSSLVKWLNLQFICLRINIARLFREIHALKRFILYFFHGLNTVFCSCLLIFFFVKK